MYKCKPALQFLQWLWGLRLWWDQLQQERCSSVCERVKVTLILGHTWTYVCALCLGTDSGLNECHQNRSVCAEEAHCVANGTDSFCSCRPGFQKTQQQTCTGNAQSTYTVAVLREVSSNFEWEVVHVVDLQAIEYIWRNLQKCSLVIFIKQSREVSLWDAF